MFRVNWNLILRWVHAIKILTCLLKYNMLVRSTLDIYLHIGILKMYLSIFMVDLMSYFFPISNIFITIKVRYFIDCFKRVLNFSSHWWIFNDSFRWSWKSALICYRRFGYYIILAGQVGVANARKVFITQICINFHLRYSRLLVCLNFIYKQQTFYDFNP